MKPLVSVDCITYNHKDYIKDALDGFVMQKTNFPFEVVLHDDASTDGTQDIIREYEKNYPELFKVIYQKENQYTKANGSWTLIMKKFQAPRYRGKYIAYCEGDDYWTDPNKLQMQVDYMEQNPDCSCCCHEAANIHENKFSGLNINILEERDISIQEMMPKGGMIATPTMLCQTKFAKEWPRYREISDIFDYPLKIHLATKGRIHFFPNTMAGYRLEADGSWTRKVRRDLDFRMKHDITGIRSSTKPQRANIHH